MKRKIIVIGVAIIVVLAGAFVFYYFYLGHPSRQVLALVNEDKITVEKFNKELAKVEKPQQDLLREDPQQFLEGLINTTLLLQEAKKEGVSTPVKTYKDNTKDTVSSEESLIVEMMKKKFSTLPEVKKEEVEALYAMFKERMGGKPLKEVAPVLEQLVREGKQQQKIELFIKEIRDKAKVEIDQIKLNKMAAKPPESNTEDEFKKAIKNGKPVLVDFGANNCLPCRELRPILKEIAKEYSGKATILVIDVYKYQALAKEYKVMLIPTLVFFDSKGTEVFRHMGVLGKEKIVEKLKEIGMSV